MKLFRCMVGVLGIVAAGCSLPTQPSILFDFDVTEADADAAAPILADGSAGTLLVVGVLQPPCRGEFLTASITGDGPALILRIASDPPTEGCVEPEVPYEYVASIGNVRSGTYSLRIEHERDGARGNEFVQEEEVRVR